MMKEKSEGLKIVLNSIYVLKKSIFPGNLNRENVMRALRQYATFLDINYRVIDILRILFLEEKAENLFLKNRASSDFDDIKL